MRVGDTLRELFGDDINNSFSRIDFEYKGLGKFILSLDKKSIVVDFINNDFNLLNIDSTDETKHNIVKTQILSKGSSWKIFNLTDILNGLTKYMNHPKQQVELTLIRQSRGYQFIGGRGTNDTLENNFDFIVSIEDNIVYLNVLKTTIPNDEYLNSGRVKIQPNELFPYFYKLYSYDKNYIHLKDTELDIQTLLNNTGNLLGSDECESLLTTKMTEDGLSYYIESHIEHKGSYLKYAVKPTLDMVHYKINSEYEEIVLHDRKNSNDKLEDIKEIVCKHREGTKMKHGLPISTILSDESMNNLICDNLYVHTKSLDVLAYPKFIRYTQDNPIIATTIYTPTQKLTIQSTRLGNNLEDGYAIRVNSTSNKTKNFIKFGEVTSLKYDKCIELLRRLLLEK